MLFQILIKDSKFGMKFIYNKVVKKNCESSDFAITNISHSRAVIQVEGKQTKEILKKGSPINFNEFNINI